MTYNNKLGGHDALRGNARVVHAVMRSLITGTEKTAVRAALEFCIREYRNRQTILFFQSNDSFSHIFVIEVVLFVKVRLVSAERTFGTFSFRV